MTQNSWFRLYHEFATDPKIQMMSEALQRRFIMLLCLRCSNGDVTLHDDEVAFQLRISNEEWADTKATFLAKKLINEDNTPTAWEKRQFISDSSAERVRRHREKKKRECNVTETPPDTDTDTDTDKHKTPHIPPSSKPQAKTSSKRGKPFPDDFQVTAEMREWAAKHAPAVNLERETESLRDWAKGKGETKRDWEATWRNWMRRTYDRMTGPPPGGAAASGNVSRMPPSRHLGFDQIDYTEGLTKNADGSYNF